MKKLRAESAKSRQPDAVAGGVTPAGYFRLGDADEHIAQACSESGRQCPGLPLHF